MNRTADACNAAYKLLQDGFLKRADLVGLTVSQAREICTRAQADVDRIVKIAKKTGRPIAQVTAAKEQIAKAVVQTVKEARRGQVAQKDLRSRMGINAYRYDRKSKRQSPLFDQFGKQVAGGINKMLNEDATDGKLKEIKKSLKIIEFEADKATVARIQYELGELAKRASKWRTRLSIDSHKQAEAARRGVEG